MIATAKYSAELGPFQHKLAILNLTHTDPAAARFAIDEGMELAIARNLDEIRHEMELADIVQVNWWQHPEMDAVSSICLARMPYLSGDSRRRGQSASGHHV